MTSRRLFVWMLVATALSTVGKADAQTSFAVGTASAAPGQTASGTIEVPAGVDAALSIPVVVVNGARPGPVLALVAGAHGTEYASIIALEQLPAAVDAAQLAGTLIVVPLLNVPSFTKIVPHLNPVDGKNMNRMYPGRADGTQTERASLRHHQTGRREERSPHRLPRRRHRREPAAVLLLAEDRPRGAGCRRRWRWCSPSASTTSSSRPDGRPTRPTRAISRTPRRRAASRRSPSRPAAPARSSRRTWRRS